MESLRATKVIGTLCSGISHGTDNILKGQSYIQEECYAHTLGGTYRRVGGLKHVGLDKMSCFGNGSLLK